MLLFIKCTTNRTMPVCSHAAGLLFQWFGHHISKVETFEYYCMVPCASIHEHSKSDDRLQIYVYVYVMCKSDTQTNESPTTST